MSAGGLIVAAVLMVVGLSLSALYSGLETGLYMINLVRLKLRAARREVAALQLQRELRRSTRVLAVLLIGTNASNYLASFGLAELLHAAGLRDWTLIALEVLVFTPVVFVVGETLPKELFRTHTDRWTYWCWPLIAGSRWLFTLIPLLPSVQMMTAVVSRLAGSTRQDGMTRREWVSQLLKEGVGAGVLTEAQTTLADRALAMRDRRVADVMVRWSDVAWIGVNADRAAREMVLARRSFSRLPVMDGHRRVAGVVWWVDALLRPEEPTEALIRPAPALSRQTPILEALSILRYRRQAMAIIVDDAGQRPIGLVTLKDLVEPLTGKLAAW